PTPWCYTRRGLFLTPASRSSITLRIRCRGRTSCFAPTRAPGQIFMNKPVLLTVDDDAAVSQAITRTLRRKYAQTFRVLRAESGSAALETLRELKLSGDDAALLLADHRMPHMTGVDLLEQSVELFPDAKRVLLTAYADIEVAIRAINTVGLDYYLLKPWDPPDEKLYPALDELL